jgi:hypothetical protein
MMMLVMTNGRKEYLEQSMKTWHRLKCKWDRILIHDDSGDDEYHKWLKSTGYETYFTPEPSGFTKAMISAWSQISGDFVFHLEEDFLILEDIPVTQLAEVLFERPYLKQMALLRQPLARNHIRKGGIIKAHPERYTPMTDGKYNWLEHRVNFTCNPCVYPTALTKEYPWVSTKGSEGGYGNLLFANKENKCAYWGTVDEPHKVEHVGIIKKGFGY